MTTNAPCTGCWVTLVGGCQGQTVMRSLGRSVRKPRGLIPDTLHQLRGDVPCGPCSSVLIWDQDLLLQTESKSFSRSIRKTQGPMCIPHRQTHSPPLLRSFPEQLNQWVVMLSKMETTVRTASSSGDVGSPNLHFHTAQNGSWYVLTLQGPCSPCPMQVSKFADQASARGSP